MRIAKKLSRKAILKGMQRDHAASQGPAPLQAHLDRLRLAVEVVGPNKGLTAVKDIMAREKALGLIEELRDSLTVPRPGDTPSLYEAVRRQLQGER